MKRIIDRVIIIASIIIYVAFLVGLVYFGVLVVRTIKMSKYIDIPRGVYRCEEYGIVITVYWDEETPKEYPNQDHFNISFDKNENIKLLITLSADKRDSLRVWQEDWLEVTESAFFRGKVTLHEDGSFEWSIDYQRNAEEFGIKVGDKLRFIRISDVDN